MSPLELFLSGSGIVLALIFSPPALRGIKRAMDALERWRWSGAQYRLGILQNKSHIGFDIWSCDFRVDDEGNCVQRYDVRIVNLSEKLVSEFFLPVFCDTHPLPVEEVAVWAKAGRKKLDVFVDSWDEQRSEGRFLIKFPLPVGPGDRLRFSYGIELPRLFQPGDDYYNWDVEVPYYDLSGKITFSDGWIIKYARWASKEKRFTQLPIIQNNRIEWKVSFPKRKTRLHMDVGLAKKTERQSREECEPN